MRCLLWLIAATAWGLIACHDALARPSLGNVGAAGGRLGNVGGGGGISRPSGGAGGISRPSGGANRPSAGNITRPSTPNVTRPAAPSRPGNIGNIGSGSSRPTRPNLPERPNIGGGNVGGNIGGNRPNVRPPTNLPSVNRPDLGNIGSNRPGIGDRPNITLPNRPGGNDRPNITLPNRPGGDRPSLGEITRPTLPGRPGGTERPTLPGRPDRPDLGGIRPELPIRPDRPTLPGRPGEGDRPTLPGRPDRPGIGDLLPERPDRPIDRPIIGGPDRPRPERPGIERPGIDRPGIDRPGIGDRWPDRPIIGDRPDWIRPEHPIARPTPPIIGGPNRPGNNWNNGWTNWGVHRPGWNTWPAWWNTRVVHHHHHWWHNGCWNNHWHNHWHAPIVWTGIGWSIGARWNAWGVGPVFVNPHFVATSGGFDYSQPIVINNIVTAESSADATATATSENAAALALFDEGIKLFQAGQAEPALAKFNAALQDLPGDPVLHEVKALALFALGRFRESAAVLNALLAVAPGMDWTSMSNLYGDVEQYTAQLRALEEHIRKNPSDASAMFVLAYHYLVIGQNDAAIKMLKEVVRLKPDDVTAKRMLEALNPPEDEPSATVAEEQPAEDGPTTDLVGKWKSDDGQIQLIVDAESQFVWQATPPGKPAVKLSGDLIAASDTIALETEDAGTMVGQVRSGGADKFTLMLQGMPANDAGIAFIRQK